MKVHEAAKRAAKIISDLPFVLCSNRRERQIAEIIDAEITAEYQPLVETARGMLAWITLQRAAAAIARGRDYTPSLDEFTMAWRDVLRKVVGE